MTADHLGNPKNAAQFNAQSDNIFGRIASRYDVLCDFFSLGIHRLWKRKVARAIAEQEWTTLLDAAAGTGDVILKIAQLNGFKNHQRVIVSDISPEMLAIAKRRANGLFSNLDFQILDAHNLDEILSNSVDLYSISLGLKICDRHRVFKEAMRVLRPGGRFISLEASNIRWAWVHRLYLGYMQLCMPFIGWLATGGDASAYQYLLKGVQGFPTAEKIAFELTQFGYEKVSFERLTFGIVAIHIAHKPQ